MDRERIDDLPEEELSAILNYLSNGMSGNERDVFDQRLANDPEWRRKVTQVKGLLIGIREANLREYLDGYHPRGTDATMKRFLKADVLKKWCAAAAIVLVTLTGVWWLWTANPSDARLYHSYFVVDAGLPVEMGSADTLVYAFYDGMISYKEGNYPDALAKWNAVAEEAGPTDTLQYYRGIAHMAMGHVDEAIALLAVVAGERASVYYQDANWYLALCYLKRGDRKTASKILSRIADRESAKELKEKLE